LARRCHLAIEGQGDQHVNVGEPRDDAGLIGRDHVARRGQAGADGRLERCREGSGEGDS
jgi:hypothetical protein